tara:strand:- start:566 stop:688 length:123 start_codon:yes stop_codon:yes gene_type:complete
MWEKLKRLMVSDPFEHLDALEFSILQLLLLIILVMLWFRH